MARQTEAVNQTQDELVDLVRRSQDAVLTAIRTWSDSVVRLVPDFSSLPAGDQDFKPREAVDSAFAFAERLLNTQRRFAHDVVSALVPAVEAAETDARPAAVTREDRLRALEEIRTLQGRFLPPDELDRLTEQERDQELGGLPGASSR